MPKYVIEERQEWRWWVTPKPLAKKAIHRWYVFPHSFTSELVHAFIDEWSLNSKDKILDPFAGAGTTLLAAKEKGIPTKGYDLSPLSVLSSKVKTENYNPLKLRELWQKLSLRINMSRRNNKLKNYPQLVQEALPGKILDSFDNAKCVIEDLTKCNKERDFYKLALLATIPEYSRAVATGGWLKWVRRTNNASTIYRTLDKRVTMMIEDLTRSCSRKSLWRTELADARSLPDRPAKYSAVITSPPYPNRHDYTRVFGVELMFGFLDWEHTRKLRYQSIQSHPEAHPHRLNVKGYVPPYQLKKTISEITKKENRTRIGNMINGYFLDMYLVLREVKRVCKHDARIAFVVGNAQYYGVPVLVDEILAKIGEQVGLKFEKMIVARYRGNSAQQMGKYGINPSRETVLIFRK